MTFQLPIYLDNNATTRCDPAVVEAMLPYFSEWYGNPATGLHSQGREAARAIDIAREQTAVLIGGQPSEIIFTSGATESNNLAILGLGRRAIDGQRKRIVTTAVEHKAVLEPCQHLRNFGYELIILPTDSNGYIDPEVAKSAINEHTLFISIQAANNEIGTLQAVATIADFAHERGAIVHCDAAQAVGKIALDVVEWEVDLLSFSAHKFYGPKGVGALYIRNGHRAIPLEPLAYGGGQEQSLRSGTSNVAGIVGIGAAADLCTQNLSTETAHICQMRDTLEQSLQTHLPNSWINGFYASRLPNTTSLTVPGIDVDALLLNMPSIMAGIGSACSTGALEPSHVLQAIGLNRTDANATIRLSLGRFNFAEEIPFVVNQIVTLVQ